MARRATHTEISRRLRERVIGGDWRPGRRLPTRLELEKELGASTATIQKAVDQLVAHGFLETRGRAGTFVSPRLPHVYRVALALPPRPGPDHPASRFWRTLREAAELLGSTSGLEVCPYYDVSIDPPSDSFERLAADIENDRIGGLLGLSIDWENAPGTVLLDHPRLARVAIRGAPVPGVCRIGLEPYAERVVAAAAEDGRGRLAVIHHASQARPPGEDRRPRAWREAAERHGLQMREAWAVPIHPATPQTAEVAVRLMMDLPAGERPDALVIQDDHLVESATAGLHRSGVHVPGDIAVFAHCNFPDRPPSSVPVRWVGYDMVELVRVGIDTLRRQLCGEQVDPEPAVPSRFETELEAPASG